MKDYGVLRQKLQDDLAAAYQLMDDKEYGAAALLFRDASAHAAQIADRLGREAREREGGTA